MRSVIAFRCEDEQLLGTLDPATGITGLLIVSGGNEVRAGAHRGMATLAQALATAGTPVFRYDRRGVGDSSGENHGYPSSGPDIAAAAATFHREQPQLTRIVGLGNCDAAAALALFGRDAGLDALILTNPWLSDDPLPPPATVRRHYLRRLASPRDWASVNLRKLAAGLRRSVSRPSAPPLATRYAATGLPTTVILAGSDRTAQQFAAACPRLPATTLATASHSFADVGEALADAILSAIGGAALTT